MVVLRAMERGLLLGGLWVWVLGWEWWELLWVGEVLGDGELHHWCLQASILLFMCERTFDTIGRSFVTFVEREKGEMGRWRRTIICALEQKDFMGLCAFIALKFWKLRQHMTYDTLYRR